ncbi:MAG TPA: hypothetical protein VMY05_04890 [Acidobacteriota bacterium]|nr:hypothetical protein [Acidobacteriota bacterium]
MLNERGVPTYSLSNRTKCFYFTEDILRGKRIDFQGVDGARAHRQLIGFKTVGKKSVGGRAKRMWHFALSSRPLLHPELAYVIRPHVLFSDDGVTIWESKERLHAARRSQCKDWWNDDWRDRILAGVMWLSDGADMIQLPISNDATLHVERSPVIVSSPVTYAGPVSVELETFDEHEDESDVGTENWEYDESDTS